MIKVFTLSDNVIDSPNLFSCLYIDSVQRKLMLVSQALLTRLALRWFAHKNSVAHFRSSNKLCILGDSSNLI